MKNKKKLDYKKDLLLLVGVILLTLWQINFIDWFPEYKTAISWVLYYLISVFLIYLLIDGFKNRGVNKNYYILFPAAFIFLALLVFTFLPEELKSKISFIRMFE